MRFFIVLLLCIVSSAVSAAWYEFFQYPEDRYYTAADRGLRPYRTLSVYKTGTFTLTFDDGPHPQITPALLDVLKKYDKKAVFFVLTSLINEETFPIIKRMLDEGHLVASHGLTHDRAADLDQQTWKARVKQSFMDLAKWYKKAGHQFNKFYYRFPFGDYGTRPDYHHINTLKEISYELLGDNCIHMAFWDIDTADWLSGMTPEEVAQNIKAMNEGGTYINFKKEGSIFVKHPITIQNPPAGGVILQHDIRELTPKATHLFLEYANQENLNIVRLDQIDEFAISKNCSLTAP
jgi:peptidoglycan/xylan/chitin deacetylase (PgdA/CDA1 family)